MILESIGKIELGLSVRGQLNSERFDFDSSFSLKLSKAGINWNWKMHVNYKLSDVLALVKQYWSRIKIWIMDQVPGLSKIL